MDISYQTHKQLLSNYLYLAILEAYLFDGCDFVSSADVTHYNIFKYHHLKTRQQRAVVYSCNENRVQNVRIMNIKITLVE